MDINSILRAEAIAIARTAKKSGLTQSLIATALNASQSQVSRVLAGRARRRSRIFDEVCKYVNSVGATARPSSAAESTELMSALSDVWDGSHKHAKALAVVIRSLGALSPIENVPRAPRAKSSGKVC